MIPYSLVMFKQIYTSMRSKKSHVILISSRILQPFRMPRILRSSASYKISNHQQLGNFQKHITENEQERSYGYYFTLMLFSIFPFLFVYLSLQPHACAKSSPLQLLKELITSHGISLSQSWTLVALSGSPHDLAALEEVCAILQLHLCHEAEIIETEGEKSVVPKGYPQADMSVRVILLTESNVSVPLHNNTSVVNCKEHQINKLLKYLHASENCPLESTYILVSPSGCVSVLSAHTETPELIAESASHFIIDEGQ